MPTFATRIPTNSASFHEPNVIVRTPNAKRIPFGIVRVLARMMLAYERLERWRGSFPRASRRRCASAWLSPSAAMSLATAMG
jgi:hypothetical protein